MTEWSASYDVHGVSVAVRSDNAGFGIAIDRRLAAFRRDGDHGADVAITVTAGAPLVPAELRTGRPVYDRPGAPVRYDEASDSLLLDEPGRAVMVCDAGTGAVQTWYADDSAATIWLVSHGMITIALLECLKRRGRYGLHAAAVAADGHAVLLPATSGGGKTTLSLALTHSGFSFMSDDLVFVRAPEESAAALTVLGFPDEVDLCADAGELLPWAAHLLRRPARPGYPKWPVDIRDAVPNADVAMSATATAVVLPDPSGTATSQLTSMSGHDALLLILPSVLLTDPVSSQRHVDVIARICDRVPCYQLRAGRDDLGALAGLLTQRVLNAGAA